MPRTICASGRVWAISPRGNLRHAEAASEPAWQEAPALPSAVVALCAVHARAAVIAACRDGTLHLLHAKTAELLASAPAPLHAVPLCVLALPAENAVFAGLQDGAVVRLHLASLAFDCMLGCGVEHSAAVNALDADEQYLYSAGEDAVVLVWDLKDATAVREISLPSAPVRSLLRVDVGLWVGLDNGAVEIFDIFGEDTNGIERIASQTPHKGPVTDLVQIGETEVWSVSAPPDQLDLSLEHPSTVAIWDTRDLSCVACDETTAGLARDVMSVTVLERIPFEEVTVLALNAAMSPHFVAKQVKGSMLGHVDEGSEYFDMYSDHDPQLLPGNDDDLSALRDDIARHMPSYQKSLEDDRLSVPFPDTFVASPGTMPMSAYPYEDDIGDEGLSVQIQSSRTLINSPPIAEQEVSSLALPRSVSESVLKSMQRLSELLVSLLTDDVLSPSEGHTAGSSDELRAAVASITRELNIGRQLVESCVSGNISDNSVVTVDENDLSRSGGKEKLPLCDAAAAELRKELEKEKENIRVLKKDLGVVTKERDLLAQDLEQVKSQSENTLTSLEGLIRDNDSVVASKDALVQDLQKECKRLDLKCQSEAQRREEIEQALRLKLEHVSKSLESTKRTSEEQVKSAYDKLETKSIEIQAQRDSLRAAEKQLDALRMSAQSSDEKRKGLEQQLAASSKTMQQAADDFAARSAQVEHDHRNEMARIEQEHIIVLDALRKKLDDSIRNTGTERAQWEHDSVKKGKVISQLRKDEEVAQRTLDGVRTADAVLNGNETVPDQVAMESEKHLEDALAKIAELQANIERTRLEAEQKVTSNREQYDLERSERQAQIDDLEALVIELRSRAEESVKELDELREEAEHLKHLKSELQQELEHRVAAADLYERESESIKSAASSYQAASEQLQVALSNAENETEQLKAQLDKLRESMAKRTERSLGEQAVAMGLPGAGSAESSGLEDSKLAMQALLASANGEIEQMSTQLEAMHKIHMEQEKELSELRAALVSPQRAWPSQGLPENNMASEPLGSEYVAQTEIVLPKKYDVSLAPYANAPSPAASNVLVNTALQEVQDDMAMTQDKVKELSTTARKYKRAAQSHLEVLPALCELEAELVRVCREDTRKAGRLASARGIVQSVIAQYFSSAEKRSVLNEFDEAVYAPSPRRLEALQQTVAQMRIARVSSPQPMFSIDDALPATGSRAGEVRRASVNAVPSPRRVLTF